MQIMMRRGRRRRLARLVSTRETTDRAKNGVPHHQSGSVFTAKREISDESPRFAVQSPVSRGLHLPDHATRVPCAEDSTALGASQRRGPIRWLGGNWIGRIGRVRRAPVRARRGRHEKKRSRGLRVFRPRARHSTRTRGARRASTQRHPRRDAPGECRGPSPRLARSARASRRPARAVRRPAAHHAFRPARGVGAHLHQQPPAAMSAACVTASLAGAVRAPGAIRARRARRVAGRTVRSDSRRADERTPRGGPSPSFPIVRPEPPLPSSVRTT